MEQTRDELKQEAENLGIKFASNVKTEKLKELIEQHYESQSAGDFVTEVEEEVSEESEVAKTVSKDKAVAKGKQSKEVMLRTKVAEAKKKTMALTKVIITNLDKRDAEYTTTAYLGFENQHFGISRVVPLDIPVEIEAGLINVAKSTPMTIHVDEIVNGKRTGNKVPRQAKKYSVTPVD